MTRIALPSPILPPRLTAAPDASVTDSAESAPAVTDFPLTVATRRSVEGSTATAQSGEAEARGATVARRREVRQLVARRSDVAGACYECLRAGDGGGESGSRLAR